MARISINFSGEEVDFFLKRAVDGLPAYEGGFLFGPMSQLIHALTTKFKAKSRQPGDFCPQSTRAPVGYHYAKKIPLPQLSVVISIY
jgi:hypothetical protein